MEQRRKSLSFYVLLLTQTISIIGSRMSAFAVGIWVFKQTGNATPLALVAFFETVPQILLSNIAGMFADRFDRRHVMMLSNVGQSISSILLMLSFFSGHFQIWHLYTVALVQSAFGVFLNPSFQSSITMLIDDKHRDRANAINQLTGPMAGVIAPGIAAALYALVGVTGVILIDFVSFIVAAVAAILIYIPRPEQSAEGRAARGSLLTELAGGFRYLFSRRILLLLLGYVSLINFVFNGCLVLITPYTLARTGSEAVLGVILSVMNLGAIVGGVIMSAWGGTRPRIYTIMGGIIVSSLGLAAYGLSRSPWALGAALFVLMFPMAFVNAAFMSILQIKIPPDLQGRVFAVVMQLAMLLSPIAFLLVGPLADQVFEPAVDRPGWERIAPLVGNQPGAGMGLIMLLGGVVIGVLSLAMVALRAVRHMETDLPDYKVEEKEQVPGEEIPELAVA